MAGVGACCFLDDSCAVGSVGDCDPVDGAYLGDFTLCFPAFCPFDVVRWNDPAGGVFGDPFNWLPTTVPGAESVLFDLEAGYTVAFDGDFENPRAEVAAGDVGFDLQGHSYTLTGADDFSLEIRPSARLTLAGGVVECVTARVNAAGPGNGLVVAGTGTALTVLETLCAGCLGQGDLEITSGAGVISRDATIGSLPGSTGSLALVTGSGSTWDVPLFLTVDNGTLRVEDRGEVSVGFGIFVFESGVITGDGTINGDVINFGRLDPGPGPRQFTVNGGYVQVETIPALGESSGTLAIGIAGPAAGLDHDVLVVSGTATLGGGLLVDLEGGFDPPLGSSFDVLVASSVFDAFDVALFPGLPDGRFMRVGQTVSATAGGIGAVSVIVENLGSLFGFEDPFPFSVLGCPRMQWRATSMARTVRTWPWSFRASRPAGRGHCWSC